jgi:hypothetical protein
MARDKGTKAARDAYLANRWSQVYLPAAVAAKRRFQKDTDEVDLYFKSDHDHLYKEVDKLMSRDGLLTLTVNMAAQIRGYMGPHLYAKHPIRVVTPASSDSVTRWFAKVCEVYLNAIPYECDLKEEVRCVIDDSLLAGRGASLVEKDESRDVITSRHVPIDDLFIDPDARCLGDAQWIAIRCTEPLWLVKKRYKTGGGDEDPTKGLRYNAQSYMESAAGVDKEAGKLLNLGDARYKGKTTELCTYFKVWSKFGSGLLHGKRSAAERDHYDMDLSREPGSRYRYMVIVPGHSRPLYEGDWPIPLHLDEDWPIGLLDFTPVRKGDKKDPLWPVSLMKLGLSHQKAIDVLCTILLNDTKFKSRTVAGVLGDKHEDVKEALSSGDLHVAINLDPQDGVQDIRQVFQLMDLGQVDPNLIPQIEWHERKFGEITGLNPILKGNAAQVEAQVRSATEASMRDRNSRSRLEDMNERVESFASKMARREQLAMRLSLTPEDVERVVKGKLGPVPWKVRFSIGRERFSVGDMKRMWPSAAEYFPNREAAEKAVEDLLTRGRQALQLGWETVNPGLPFLPQAEAVEVDMEELWFDTAGSDAEALARDYTVRIEAGSARRIDWNLVTEQNAFLLQEVGHRAAAMADFTTYNKCLDRVQESLQIPREKRIFLDTQAMQQKSEAAKQEQEQQIQKDHMRKAQLEVAKGDVKGRSQAQAILLKGQVDSTLQSQRLAAEAAMDKPGGGGWQ